MKKFWIRGEPYVWATGLSLSLVLLLTGLLLYVVLVNGLGVFWPQRVDHFILQDGRVVMGEITQREHQESGPSRLQLKIGNREYGLDFMWVDMAQIKSIATPPDAYVLERQEYGNYYGFLKQINIPTLTDIKAGSGEVGLEKALDAVARRQEKVEEVDEKIADLNVRTANLQQEEDELRYEDAAGNAAEIQEIAARKEQIKERFDKLVRQSDDMRRELNRNKAVFTDAQGREKEIALTDIVRAYQPNSMSFSDKIGFYISKVVELFIAEPRESNTEGGLFPAIFGTVMLIFLMSILSFPLGVVAGIYLREYAKEGILVRLVRIAVNNLAGIPSIVYGIFGLGFFVYGIGSGIDQLFFPERLPTPTFGTGGILWASLTLGLLTVPVVIVATEEALGSIPPGIREGSLALAATKYQTLKNLLLPMASPGILTGFILAMARAAGEVAPLMITGVVKLAPALPVDGNFPYLHLDRKFMHLGFHIYDIGFQSPNVEAAKPMVYVTTLLLITIVLVLTSTAIHLRNVMRKRYAVSDV